MNALFTQLLKPFAPMQQDHIEPEQLMEPPKPVGRWDMPSEHKAEGFSALGVPDIAPHIAKIPLRAEHRALLQAADAYEANAARLLELAWQAREQADNLKRMGNL